MKKIFLVISVVISSLFIVFIIAMPSEQVLFKEFIVEGKLSISTPEYLIRTNDIDTSALLQFKNEKKQIFLLVYETRDSVQMNFKERFHREADELISRMDNGNLRKLYPEKIDGIDALIGIVGGSVNGTAVNYTMILLNNNAVIYKILIGITENNKGSVKEDIDQIIKKGLHFFAAR